MRYLLFFLLICVGNILNAQTTVQGYWTYYESAESSAHLNRYFSTEVYNVQGKKIYEKVFPIENSDSIFNIRYFIGNSNDYVSENIVFKDTARYIYIHDTINSRNYIIINKDTTFIYETKYENNLLIERTCLKGCSERDYIHYNSFGLPDTTLTIWKNGQITYTIQVYDQKKRPILSKSMLDHPEESGTMSVMTVYDDLLMTKTQYYGGYGLDHWDQNNDTVILHFNELGIPIRQEMISTVYGKKQYYLIEYQSE